MRGGGGSEDFMGGGAHFFPNLKRGGHVFFQILTDILSKSEFLFID